ncbi:MAG: DUF1080 domain-containing protein [Bacteroidota bacterium]
MNRRSFIGVLVAGLTVCSPVVGQERAEWHDLFNGSSLEGWQQLNGKATYEAKDGMIVGTSVLNSSNSFLCTKKSYGNFVLELDFKVDEGLNSGVQIRSESIKEYQNGRVHGYQVEIDPAQKELYHALPNNLRADGKEIGDSVEPRRWTGGIYDEGRRGWLGDLTHNEKARLAFKPEAWNHFRIEAIGDGIRTWINGIFAAGFADAMTPNGFIGLQVHATKVEKPMHVYFKNLRIQDLGFNDARPDSLNDLFMGDWQSSKPGIAARVRKLAAGKYRALLFSSVDDTAEPIAVLEGAYAESGISLIGGGWSGGIQDGRLKIQHGDQGFEARRVQRHPPTLNAPPPDGAVILFNGTNVDEWLSQKTKDWLNSDGPATDWRVLPGGRLEVVAGAGSIISKKQFGDYKLHAEFRLLGETTNGGMYQMARYEINIKDSYGQLEGAPCGALGNFAQNLGSIPNASLPPFQWQTLDIDFRAPRFDASGLKTEHAQITVVLNGVTLYEKLSIEGVKGAAGRLGEASQGPLMLQEHGTPYQFRNIWIVDTSSR